MYVYIYIYIYIYIYMIYKLYLFGDFVELRYI